MILSTTPNWLRTSLGRKSSAVKMYFLCHWHQCDLRPKCLLSVEFISYKVWCWTEALLMTLTAILLLLDDSVYCGWFEVSFEQVMLYRPCRLSCKQTVKHFMFIFSKPEGWVDRSAQESGWSSLIQWWNHVVELMKYENISLSTMLSPILSTRIGETLTILCNAYVYTHTENPHEIKHKHRKLYKSHTKFYQFMEDICS